MRLKSENGYMGGRHTNMLAAIWVSFENEDITGAW